MNDDEQPDDETAARLIADAEQQVRLPAIWAKVDEALEHEQFTGPMSAARYAGERAAAIARTAAERADLPLDEMLALRKRAYFAAYFQDLAEEAALRAEFWREAMRQHGDPPLPEPRKPP
jgi:hypothetical protein